MKKSKAALALKEAHRLFKIAKNKAYKVYQYSNKVVVVSWAKVLKQAWGLFKNPIAVVETDLVIDFKF